MTSASNKKTSSTLPSRIAKPAPKSWARNYWELARMHKFPAGSTHLFWPAGKEIHISRIFGLSDTNRSMGLHPRRS